MRIEPAMLVQRKETGTADPEEFDIGVVLKVDLTVIALVHWFRANERHDEYVNKLAPADAYVARNTLRWVE